MMLLSTSALKYLTRAAYQPFRIPSTRTISIQPRIPRFPPPPPARRRFEPILPQPQPDPTPKPNRKPEHTRSAIERRPTNRQIPFDHVYVIDPETNKLSATKQRLETLLETRERRVIELVASSPEPIVRVTTRSEIEVRYKEMKQALRKGVKVSEEAKEVHLLWGVAKADVEHKLRKARRDLEKGYRVVVIVNMKNGHRPSSRRQLVALADEISETLSEGGEEWKEREFSDRSMMLSFRKSEQALQ